MYGFKKGEKPEQKEKLRNGGMIQGPGTGTSDSIKTGIPKGSYIMPADSTQQIGPKALGEFISAASQHYRHRISVEELRLEVAKFNAGTTAEVGMNNVRAFGDRVKAMSETLAAAARAAGDQAAAALNAVHASAQAAVQGETA